MNRIAWAMAALLIVLSCPVSADLLVTTIVTDADAYPINSYGAKTTWNYGGSTTLGVQATSGIKKPYLDFNLLANLDPSLTVQEARLQLTRDSWNATYGKTATVCGFTYETADWDPAAVPEGTGNGVDTPELDLVWDNAPSVGTAYAFVNEGTAITSKVRTLGTYDASVTVNLDMDVTDFIRWALGQYAAYADTIDPNFTNTDGRVTFGLEAASDIYLSFRSKEYADVNDSDAPKLVVTQVAVPEPGTLALLALPAAAALARRRR